MTGHPDLSPLMVDTDLPADRRRSLLGHVERCPACRAALAEHDPGLVFALLALEPVPGGVLDRVSRGVARAIDESDRKRAPIRRMALGALAASVLLAGLVGAYVWNRRAPGPTAPASSLAEGVAAPRPAEAGSGPAVEADAVPAGMIELLESPGKAEVVEFAVGNAKLTMIFDEALDI